MASPNYHREFIRPISDCRNGCKNADGINSSGILLWTRCGMATNEQIEHGIKTAVATASDKLEIKLCCDLDINVIYQKDGTSRGIAYIHIISRETANILRGLNLDGSTRVTVEPQVLNNTIVKSLDDELHTDTQTVDENITSTINTSEKKEYISLFEQIKIMYTPEQQEVLNANITKKDWNKNEYTLRFGWAEIKTSEQLNSDGLTHNVLSGRLIYDNSLSSDQKQSNTQQILDDISDDEIRDIFLRFNTSKNKTKEYGSLKSYPIIVRTNGSIDIIYDPLTDDAQIAFQMRFITMYQDHLFQFSHRRTPQQNHQFIQSTSSKGRGRGGKGKSKNAPNISFYKKIDI